MPNHRKEDFKGKYILYSRDCEEEKWDWTKNYWEDLATVLV